MSIPTPLGTINKYEPFPSTRVDPRNIHVWLPPAYNSSSSSRYAVLYMQDGQNLFEPHLAYAGVDWGIDETLTKLMAERAIRDTIVVGIWNTPKRDHEYLPAKLVTEEANRTRRAQVLADYELAETELLSDTYLKFIVRELKPFVDHTYRTRTEPNHTVIMGSSAGALLSLYAICEYPDIFGGAGCVSTHWPVANGLLIDYADRNLPSPNHHRIYFDHGTKTIDAAYGPYQERMDRVMERNGYTRGQNWVTNVFPNAEHTETAWRQRAHIPLKFLLPPPSIRVPS